jgi:hypothetical protein
MAGASGTGVNNRAGEQRTARENEEESEGFHGFVFFD